MQTHEQVIREITQERERQISAEGWTPEHDDGHSSGELAGAAACYATTDIPHWAAEYVRARIWPFSTDSWKPASRRRNLVKAAALIVAEIERLDRAASA